MSKVVSFNTDVPGLKPKGLPPEDESERSVPAHEFNLDVSGDYLSFAGQRELRAWIVTASNGSEAYSIERQDKAALLGWFLDVLKAEPKDASRLVEQGERGEPIFLRRFLRRSDLESLGFEIGAPRSKAAA